MYWLASRWQWKTRSRCVRRASLSFRTERATPFLISPVIYRCFFFLPSFFPSCLSFFSFTLFVSEDYLSFFSYLSDLITDLLGVCPVCPTSSSVIWYFNTSKKKTKDYHSLFGHGYSEGARFRAQQRRFQASSREDAGSYVQVSWNHDNNHNHILLISTRNHFALHRIFVRGIPEWTSL